LLLQVYRSVPLLLLLLLQQLLLLLLLLLLLHHIASHAPHVGPHLLPWVRWLRLHALRNVSRQHVATSSTPSTPCTPMLPLLDESSHQAGVGLENLQDLLLLLR
jgi:hypothetical protein